MNVKFEYLYRDAGNNKIWGEVVFSNSKNIDFKVLDTHIRKLLIDHEFFIAQKSNLPRLSFQISDQKLDHDWYEYSSIDGTTDHENDIYNRDIKEFIGSLKQASLI